jgi:predicted ATPase
MTTREMQLFVLVIEHRHGTSVTAHLTEEQATARLDEWVGDWWAEELPDREMPDDVEARRREYFEHVEGESYVLEPTTLTLPDEPSHWDNDPLHPVSDWQYEVANGGTRLGYREWVQQQTEIAREEQQ